MTPLAIIAGIPVGIIALIGMIVVMRSFFAAINATSIGRWIVALCLIALMIGLVCAAGAVIVALTHSLAAYFIPLFGAVGGWFVATAVVVIIMGGSMVLQHALEGQN